jgi:hypothetical protein
VIEKKDILDDAKQSVSAFWKGLSQNVKKGLDDAAKTKDKVKFPFSFGKASEEKKEEEVKDDTTEENPFIKPE